jgi:hypothetical protein
MFSDEHMHDFRHEFCPAADAIVNDSLSCCLSYIASPPPLFMTLSLSTSTSLPLSVFFMCVKQVLRPGEEMFGTTGEARWLPRRTPSSQNEPTTPPTPQGDTSLDTFPDTDTRSDPPEAQTSHALPHPHPEQQQTTSAAVDSRLWSYSEDLVSAAALRLRASVQGGFSKAGGKDDRPPHAARDAKAAPVEQTHSASAGRDQSSSSADGWTGASRKAAALVSIRSPSRDNDAPTPPSSSSSNLQHARNTPGADSNGRRSSDSQFAGSVWLQVRLPSLRACRQILRALREIPGLREIGFALN